jgi:hypothetical protein
MPFGADARATIDALRDTVELLCVAIEGSDLANARIKLYWRTPHVVALHAMGIPLFADPAFAHFAGMTVGGRTMRVSGLVYSAGFNVSDGTLCDVKLDICACERCAARPSDEWNALLLQCARTFDVVPFDADVLRHGRPAYFGFGLKRDGERRLNLYVNPSCAA